jgi:ferric-dicitrate binding protein FerR (iron transport regulator)
MGVYLNKRYKDLLTYLKGGENENGKALFDRWYAEKVNDQVEGGAEPEMLRDTLLEAINQKIEYEEKKVGVKRFFIGLPRHLRIAASVIILLGAGFSAWLILQNNFSQAPVMVSTLAGEMRHVELPDGSLVHLNAASSITYEKDFDSKYRKVKLEGEAYFEVVRDESKPFVVQAGTIQTKVLGTKFNVRAYTSDVRQSISLVEGKVQVKHGGDETILQPMQEYSIERDVAKGNIKDFDLSEVTGWREGRMVFKDRRLEEVFLALERYYGYTIHVNDSILLNKHITATFDNLRIDEVWHVIGFAAGIECTTIDSMNYEIAMKR